MKNIRYYIYLTQLILIFLTTSEISAQDPLWNITTLNNPAPGYLRFDWISDERFFLLDNYGIQQYIVSENNNSYNYKLLKNGLWMAFDLKMTYLYNQDLQLTDSIPHLSKYYFDYHDAEVLSNGHYLFLYRDTLSIDLSKIVDGGMKNAFIRSGVLIETDRTGKVFWEWKAFDHLKITDVTDDIDLTAGNIDFTHINSFVEDEDGNILVSFRHLDEIIKINKTTGDIIWRLGGTASKSNEFTILNDEYNGFRGFSHQHAISLLPNGNLLMFDNGNLKVPQFSRTVEYKLDQLNKTATKIWEYRNTPDVFLSVMGSAYRMPNGNTLINGGNQQIIEVTPDKSVALSIDYSASKVKNIYRVYKVITKMNAVSKNIYGSGIYSFNDDKYTTGVNLSVTTIIGGGLTSFEKHNYAPPYANYNDSSFSSILPFRWVFSQSGFSNINGTIKIKANTIANLENPNKTAIFKRSKEADFSEKFQKLTTSYDSTSGEIKADFSGFGEFVVGSYKLSIPILYYPENNAKQIGKNGLLIWKKLQGASNYQIQLSNSSDFSSIVIDSITDSIKYPYKNLNYNTDYFWRIRGLSTQDTSNWSDVNMFSTKQQIVAPRLIYPQNDKFDILINDTLKWENIIDADYYRLQVSLNEDFSEMVFDTNNLKSTEIKLINLHYKNEYFWRVISYNNNDTSKWSEVWHFTTIDKPMLKFPILFSPLDNSVNGTNGVFKWKKVDYALYYQIQVSLSSDFSNNLIDSLKITNTSFYYKNFNYNTEYYWKVKAFNYDDSSQWSEIWRFYTSSKDGIVILLSPGNDELQLPTDGNLIWNKIPGVENYRLQVSEVSDFQQNTYDKINITDNNFNYLNLKQNTQYYWRVAFYKDTIMSDWSAVWSFTTITADTLPSPLLNSPENNTSSIPINSSLDWFPVVGANHYIVSVSRFSDFHESKIRINDISDTQFYFSNLDFEEIYFWKVAAVNEKAKSRWSEIRNFITVLQAPTLVFPPENSIDQPIEGKIIWSVTHLNNTYHLQVALDSSFENIVIDTENINDVNYPYQLSGSTTYFCRVKATKAENQSLWSNTNKFTTSNTTNVNEEKNSEIISLFPNPAFDKIHFSNLKFDGSEYFIYSILGKIIDSGKISQNTIDISNLIPGLYYIKIGANFQYFVKSTN